MLLFSWQVNSNGVLSLGAAFNDSNPQLFPIDASVITAYWTTPVTDRTVVEYGIIQRSAIIQSGGIIDNVREYLLTQNIELNIAMILTAVWTDFTCPLVCSSINFPYIGAY